MIKKNHEHEKQTSKTIQQMKAPEPRLMEKYVCKVVLHICH